MKKINEQKFNKKREQLNDTIHRMVENRKAKKISQKDIAYRLGISQSAVAYFEKGKNDSATIFIEYMDMGLLY